MPVFQLWPATLIQKKGSEDNGFYFIVNERYCHGLKEDKEWTVQQWRKDQGVDIHDEINTLWADLLVRKRSFPPDIKLIEQAKKCFLWSATTLTNSGGLFSKAAF